LKKSLEFPPAADGGRLGQKMNDSKYTEKRHGCRVWKLKMKQGTGLVTPKKEKSD
jgi:hypothetical protein